mmetsp:Transcript_132953/g.384401  ORF Transcript_132953/g.384401 Transcript_132953/m.384401 type:complete len:266 (-) Transcript_132953:7-804(-)
MPKHCCPACSSRPPLALSAGAVVRRQLVTSPRRACRPDWELESPKPEVAWPPSPPLLRLRRWHAASRARRRQGRQRIGWRTAPLARLPAPASARPAQPARGPPSSQSRSPLPSRNAPGPAGRERPRCCAPTCRRRHHPSSRCRESAWQHGCPWRPSSMPPRSTARRPLAASETKIGGHQDAVVPLSGLSRKRRPPPPSPQLGAAGRYPVFGTPPATRPTQPVSPLPRPRAPTASAPPPGLALGSAPRSPTADARRPPRAPLLRRS